MQQNKLYVGNFPYSVDEDQLRDLFSPYGEIEELALIMDRDTGRRRGFGFVTMAEDASAREAIEALNGQELEGRELQVFDTVGEEQTVALKLVAVGDHVDVRGNHDECRRRDDRPAARCEVDSQSRRRRDPREHRAYGRTDRSERAPGAHTRSAPRS